MSEETLYKAQAGKRELPVTWPAALLLGAGALLLAANLLRVSLIDYLWPGFIVGAGLLLIWPAYSSTANRQSAWSFLAVPGAMLAMLGTLLFLMNLVGHFGAMAYSWPLVLAAGVGGWMLLKRFQADGRAHDRGHRLLRALVIFFMGLATFFEVVAFGSLGGWWPLLLIGFGAFLFVKHNRSKST